MSKGARTIAELDKAIALLRTRDSARQREIRAVRAELQAIERALDARLISPAANSTGIPSGPCAGTALDRARSFLRRLFARPA
jgi:hypothetical protein